MFERVNKYHPDKVADRIAGAIVDYAYQQYTLGETMVLPKIAVEVLIGHGNCHIIVETNANLSSGAVNDIVYRIAGQQNVDLLLVPQDTHLAHNQLEKIRCGDNGIFKGVVPSREEIQLVNISNKLENAFGSDGKYIINDNKLTICQSNAKDEQIRKLIDPNFDMVINPLGEWTGGTNVDTGATNRKLGSDMGRAATGGGLHGKDLSKADVSLNIFADILANIRRNEINITCSIGDENVEVDGKMIPYDSIVNIAGKYIYDNGGFEKFAEKGLLGSTISERVIKSVEALY